MNRLMGADGEAGFTLLETIIAFLVLSVSMGVTVQTVSIASRSIAIAKEKEAALNLVSVIRAEKLPNILASGKTSDVGDSGGMRWEIMFTPTTNANLTDIVEGLAVIKVFSSKDVKRHHDFAVFTSVRKQTP